MVLHFPGNHRCCLGTGGTRRLVSGCVALRVEAHGLPRSKGLARPHSFEVLLLSKESIAATNESGYDSIWVVLGNSTNPQSGSLQFEGKEPNIANAARIRILSVEDHPSLREGLARVINTQPDMDLVAQACDGREAIEQFRKLLPDVTLMDLRLPDKSGLDTMISILSEFPGARVIILTTFAGDVEIEGALKAGARAYLVKTMPASELMDVIRRVHSGKIVIPSEIAACLAEHFADDALTERETEVLRLVTAGNRNRDIGECLSICAETAKAHMKHIMEKLGAADRTQAMAIAARRGIIQL